MIKMIDKPNYAFNAGEITWVIKDWVALYGVLILFGFIAAIATAAYFWKREKYPMDILFNYVFITIPLSILGARLLFIIEQLFVPNNTMAQSWYKIWEGGLSIQGGVILALIGDILYTYKIRKIVDYRKTLSIIVPTILIGQTIGRWGNFANHEVFGLPDPEGKSVFWLGQWISNNMYINFGGKTEYRVPLFFYESMINLIGYILLVWIINYFGLLKPGATGGLYFAWYGLVRLSMENLREESYTIYLVISIIFLILGLLIAARYQFLSNYKIGIVNKKIKLIKLQRYTKVSRQDKFKTFKYINLQMEKNNNPYEKIVLENTQ